VWSGGKGEREGETDSDIQGKAEKKMAREKERDSVLARRGTEYIGCVFPHVIILVCCRLIVMVMVSFCVSRRAVTAKTHLRRNFFLFFPFFFRFFSFLSKRVAGGVARANLATLHPHLQTPT